jgi:hypothetical protein
LPALTYTANIKLSKMAKIMKKQPLKAKELTPEEREEKY